jgi:single-strand DNA-binding protein
VFQQTIVVGNVGRDAEMRYTPSGQPVTSFSVATTRSYNNGAGEQVKETTWFRVTAWGKLAETCSKYVKKGLKVLVEGRLTPDTATGGPKVFTKSDGTSGASYELTANTVRFLSPKGENGSSEGAEEPAEAEGTEIPF